MIVTCGLCEATLEVEPGGGRGADRRRAFNLGLCYGFRRRKNAETDGGWDIWHRYVCPDCASSVRQAIEEKIMEIQAGDR